MVAGFVVLASVHTIVWYLAVDRIADGLQGFIQTASRDGWTLNADSQERAGWPWRAALRLHHVVAVRPLGDVTVRCTAERLEIGLSPQNLDSLTVDAIGEQRLQLAPAPAMRFHATVTRLNVPLAGDIPPALELQNLETDTGGFRARHVTIRLTETTLAASIDQAGLVPPLGSPFDGPLDLRLRVRLNAPLPSAATPLATAIAWRDAGGRADLPEFTLRWGPLQVEGSGSARLDEQLRPDAQAMLQVAGAAEALDALTRASLVPAGAATAARAVIGILSAGTPDRRIALPIGVQDGVVSVARFPLLKVPRLTTDPP